MKTRFPMKLLAALLALSMLLSLSVATVAQSDKAAALDQMAAEVALQLATEAGTPEAAKEYLNVVNPDVRGAMKPGLSFNDEGEFTILQLSDICDDATPNPAMIQFIQYAVEEAKPDLVVFTGDNTNKVSSFFGRSAKAAEWLAGALGDTPFTMCFGDEDTWFTMGKMNLFPEYEKFDNFVGYQDEKMHSGVGDHMLFIFNDAEAAEAGLAELERLNGETDPVNADVDPDVMASVAFNLFIMDSGSDGFFRDQIMWYGGKEYYAITRRAGYVIPSLMFSHYPLADIKNIVGTDGKLLSSATIPSYAVGTEKQGKTPTVAYQPYVNFTETMLKFMNTYGDVKAAVSGQDRTNNFVRRYSGEAGTIDFIQTAGAGFKGTDDETRGARVITLKLNEVGAKLGETIDTITIPGDPPTEEDVPSPAVAPDVEIKETYTIGYNKFFDLDETSEHLSSRKVYYYAGKNIFFGWNAAVWANFLGLFGVNKYDVMSSMTQWFGDTFNFLFKMN